jgi:TRAP-type transport system periplasmic protein
MTGRAMGVCVSAAVLALALTGCHAGSNKAGGEAVAPTRTLTFAGVFNSNLGQATAFANEVARLSQGRLRVTFKGLWRRGQVHAERGIVEDVRQGKIAGGLVGARVFDTLGVSSFDALLAPLLVDTYALEGRVFAAGIPQKMLPSVSRLGLVGIAVLPGPLRRMFGRSHPFLHPTDFAGQVVGIQESAVARETLRTLGAKVEALPGGASLEGVDGYEQQLASIVGSSYAKRGTYVTTNLNLWPRPLVLVLNKRVAEALTSEQRGWLREAAARSIGPALAASRAEDEQALKVLCKGQESLVSATESDLGDLRAALAPVYARISAQPQTGRWLAQIEALKQEIGPEAPACPAPPQEAAPTPSELEGVYEVSISRSEWVDAVGLADSTVPAALGGVTIRLEFLNGRFLLSQLPRGFVIDGRYGVDGKDLRLQLPVSGAKDTGIWNLDWNLYRGALSLQGAEPYWIGLKPWRRVDDAHASDFVVQPVTSLPPNGVYENKLTVDELLRDGTDSGYAEGNAADYRVAYRNGRWWFVAPNAEHFGGTYWVEGGRLHVKWRGEGPGYTSTWSLENGVLRFHHVVPAEEVGDLLNSGAAWRKIR